MQHKALYSASSFYMFRASTTPIIRSTQNCNYSLRQCAATSLQRGQAIYINNCPTRCNTQQSIYYSASSLYMFRVSTTPIIISTQNCNYSLRYWSYFLCSNLPPTWPSWPHWREVAAQYRRLQCCICRWVTKNLCVSTWTGTQEYCRAEAMGVILGVVDSTIAETKQKNLLS